MYTMYNMCIYMKHDDVKALFDRRKVLHTLSSGWGWSEGPLRSQSLHPLQKRKGPHDVMENRLWWHRLHLPTSDHPPSRSSTPQHFNKGIYLSCMIGKTLAVYSDRRKTTRLHMQLHRDHTPSDGRQTFVAASYLPANCGTATLDMADVLCSGSLHSSQPENDDTSSSTTGSNTQTLMVSVDDAGRLVCTAGDRCPAAAADCSCWILSVPLADDCHAYNCRLSLLAAGTLGLHTTAAVMPGQPLKMWFPPDLQLMLHVPFLTPVNIRDERKYVCHKCGYTCEKPNPLKIHMALDCGRRPRAKLWSRLAADHCASGRTIEASFRFSLTPAESRAPLTSASADSAFRPYSPESSASSGGGPAPPSPLRPPPPTRLSSTSSSSDRTPLQDGPLRQSIGGSDTAFFDRRCAEMETIVSNLGHSDQGHLCIYCGKVYSRKYGLKIHIRTHTGFKPLKCKYCYRPFGDPSNLNKHVRLHAEGDTPYKCDCCGKILVRKRDLDRHMKSRHAQVMQKNIYKMHVPV